MKKVFNILKHVLLIVVFVVCLLTLISSSVLMFNRNEYGYAQFNDKTLVIIDKSNAGIKYKKGQLVVVKSRRLVDFDGSDEVFIYNTESDNVSVSYSKIVEINKSGNKAIVLLENGRELTSDEVVVGEEIKTYNFGTIVMFLQSKWGFISSLIPCFLVLLYLVFSIFISKKKRNDEEEVFLINEIDKEIEEAEVPTIVGATENEPLKVKSDDFSVKAKNLRDVNPDISKAEDEIIVETGDDISTYSEGVEVTKMGPIILEGVNENVEINDVEELTLDEDDDIELI